MIAISLLLFSVILVVRASPNSKPVSKPVSKPESKPVAKPVSKTVSKPFFKPVAAPTPIPTKKVYKAVVDAKKRVTEIHILTYVNGALNNIGGQYFFFDDATEIGYFDGDIIPGTNNALVNYGGIAPKGEPYNQVWTPYIGAEYYEYKLDGKKNVIGYSYYDKTNGNFKSSDLSQKIVVTFCTKSFKECTGLDENQVFGATVQNMKPVPTDPLALQDSVFTQVSGPMGAAPTGPNPVSFRWTFVGPYLGGALVGGYEFENPGFPLETGYYLPTSISVNAKDKLIVLSDFKVATGVNAGTHFGAIAYFTNGFLLDYYCSGTYDATGKLVLTDLSTCANDVYVASPKPDASIVKRLLAYIDKTLFNGIVFLWNP